MWLRGTAARRATWCRRAARGLAKSDQEADPEPTRKRLRRPAAHRLANCGPRVVDGAAHFAQQCHFALVNFDRKPARSSIGQIACAMLAVAERHHALALKSQPTHQ